MNRVGPAGGRPCGPLRVRRGGCTRQAAECSLARGRGPCSGKRRRVLALSVGASTVGRGLSARAGQSNNSGGGPGQLAPASRRGVNGAARPGRDKWLSTASGSTAAPAGTPTLSCPSIPRARAGRRASAGSRRLRPSARAVSSGRSPGVRAGGRRALWRLGRAVRERPRCHLGSARPGVVTGPASGVGPPDRLAAVLDNRFRSAGTSSGPQRHMARCRFVR